MYEARCFPGDIGTRPLIMGILNVTPDSFFDGGRYIAGGALARVRQMVVDGCDIVDIGAESTRPKAQAIDEAEELTVLTECSRRSPPSTFALRVLRAMRGT